jgi:very-short-patch-repair endonuclease
MRLRRQRAAPHTDSRLSNVDGDSDAQRRAGQRPARVPDVAVDRIAAALATAQHGVASREQLLAHGAGVHAIDRRVRTGRFTVVFRGVYAIGHAALSDLGRLHAALLAAGAGAVVSHHAAAALHRILPALPPFVDVTVAGRPRRSRPGLRIHGTRDPPPTVQLAGVAVTTPLRTLQDLRSVLRPAALERACAEALVRNLVTHEELEIARLVAPGEAAPTRSALERRFVSLVRKAGLPRPLINTTIGPYEVDFAWPEERVVVELDGWSAHGHRFAFERDRARDADLVARGYLVLRYTWRQLRDNPLLVATQIAQALAHRTTATSAGTQSTGGAARWAS